VVVMYFAKTILAPYICLDARVRHLCHILKCKCVMQNITTCILISLETLYSIFLVSAEVFQSHILMDITHLNCCLLLISRSLICVGYDAMSYPRRTYTSVALLQQLKNLLIHKGYVLFQDTVLSGHETPTDCHCFTALNS